LIAGRGETALETLLGLGLQLEPGSEARNALLRYLQALTSNDGSPLKRALAASRTGWHGHTFVLPDRAIGGDGLVVYQPTSTLVAAIRQRGSLDQWQETVAQPAAGNSRLVLSLSAAFGATMLGALNYPEGFGIHLRGSSSAGKTTALELAGSVWGGGGLTGYRQSWHATANGIEATAEAHCDLLLCLDELGQVRPEDAGRVAYQLSTGTGRQRALSDGMGASRREWRLVYLSTGEIGLADKLREARTPQRMMAGQAVRLIDLPADAEAGYGIFEHVPEIEGRPSATPRERGRAFADRLVAAAQSNYGMAGPAFLEKLVADRNSATEQARQVMDMLAEQLPPTDADGQVQRVARHLALIAAAGELAIALGIVPWPVGEAVRAVQRCFEDWLKSRESIGSAEADDAVLHLRAIIERDGAARFQRLDSTDPVPNRIGFIREADGDIVYLIPPETWKMVMAGRDPGRAARFLLEKGILQPGEGNRLQRKERLLRGANPQRVYAVRHSALFHEAGDNEGGTNG
jgi:putative DNA primase/helicase